MQIIFFKMNYAKIKIHVNNVVFIFNYCLIVINNVKKFAINKNNYIVINACKIFTMTLKIKNFLNNSIYSVKNVTSR